MAMATTAAATVANTKTSHGHDKYHAHELDHGRDPDRDHANGFHLLRRSGLGFWGEAALGA